MKIQILLRFHPYHLIDALISFNLNNSETNLLYFIIFSLFIKIYIFDIKAIFKKIITS
jgi:hypothetical protein